MASGERSDRPSWAGGVPSGEAGPEAEGAKRAPAAKAGRGRRRRGIQRKDGKDAKSAKAQDRVCNFRRHHKIRLGGPRPDPDIFTGQQAAEYLVISRNGLRGLIRLGAIDKNQVTDFAPWRISKTQLDSDEVQSLVRFLKREGRLPGHPASPEDQQSLFQRGSRTTTKGTP